MKSMIPDTLRFVALWGALLLIAPVHGQAASVRQVTMDEMLRQSQFVFEGKVTALQSKEDGTKRIHTLVTFAVQEIIKGEYSKGTITLSFLGGTAGEVTMAVSDMVFPRVGEHGIYFVESLDRLQVHPFYGWSQGHFLVRPDASGTDRVMTNSEQPVIEVSSDMATEQMSADQEPTTTLSQGVAHGILVAQKKKDTRGMKVDAFKKVLHERMEANP